MRITNWLIAVLMFEVTCYEGNKTVGKVIYQEVVKSVKLEPQGLLITPLEKQPFITTDNCKIVPVRK